MAFFLDTSAVIKRYVAEPGSAWVNALVSVRSRGHRIFLARITCVEVAAAFARRRRGGGLTAAQAGTVLAKFQSDLATVYRISAVTGSVLDSAAVLADRHALRGYDAVQLASALDNQRRRLGRNLSAITLVSADSELNAAAAAEGLAVDDPNLHP